MKQEQLLLSFHLVISLHIQRHIGYIENTSYNLINTIKLSPSLLYCELARKQCHC